MDKISEGIKQGIEKAKEDLENLGQNERIMHDKYTIHLTDEEYKRIIDNTKKDIDNKWRENIKNVLEKHTHTEIDDAIKFYTDIKKILEEN